MYSKKHIFWSIIISMLAAFGISTMIFSGVYLVRELTREDDVLIVARDVITQNYVDQLSDEQINKMNDAAIAAMVESLEDPYSYYLDMENFDQYEENNEEEYVGIGVSVAYDAEKGTLTVTAPTAGGPAEKAGIIPQDLIVGVDELKLETDGYDAIINHIKRGGKEGDTVKVHIVRGGEEKTFDIVRAVISLDTITYKMLDNDVAYIKISEFQHNSVEDFSEALSKAEAQGADGLVIDLRSNPGGYANSVIEMTDMLLPEGTIAYLEDNKGNKEYFESDEECIDIPIVVLINEGTASASELMAGSLQAYERATIVGMKSYGKAVGQAPYMLTEETAIYLTTARYYTPKGECIDKKGITPDIEIDLPEESKVQLSTLAPEKDLQLQAALQAVYAEIQ